MDLEAILARLKERTAANGCDPEPEYACPVCQDKGYIVWRGDNGEILSRECRCMVKKRNEERIKRSGLAGLLDRYTMEAYQVPETWQKAAKAAAEQYLDDFRGHWFFMGGNSGTGKTHLCTAICGKLINAGVPVRYMQWRADIPPLKAVVNDENRYRQAISPLKNIKALYIDDLFKGKVTDGDTNIAFEVLNHRYIDQEKITIISSELTLDRIIDIDTAIGGRIAERAKGYCLNLHGKKNWRLQ